MNFIVLSRAAGSLAALIVLLPTSSFASTGGIRLIVQEWTQTNPTVQKDAIALDKPGLISSAIDDGWTRARGPVCDALKAQAGKPDLLGHGFTLYKIDCEMAASGTLALTGFSNTVLNVSYRLPGNTFKATSTQPSVAGSYADPCFMFSYDVTANTAIHLDTLKVDPFVVSISNVSRPDSCNTAGDIAKFAATTFHFFGGKDYLALVQSSLQRTQSISTDPLNAALSPVVSSVQGYSKNYASRKNWIRNGNIYIAFAPVYVPEPLTAGIEGTISIAKSERVPVSPDCSTFALVGNVQTGPAPLYDPVGMTDSDPPIVHMGSGSAHGDATDAGARYTCAYSATQMPASVPVLYSGSGIAGPPEKGNPAYKVGLKADGWSGKVALTGMSDQKNFVAVAFPSYTLRLNAPVGRALVPSGNPAEGAKTVVNPISPEMGILRAADSANLNPQPLPPAGDIKISDGNALFAKGDFAGAAASFDKARLANGKSAVALHNLALAHAKLGQTDLAVRELHQAVGLANASGDAATANAAAKAIIIVGGASR